MQNDQLTRLERIRLECLAQAIRGPIPPAETPEEALQNVLRSAETIEAWLLAADYRRS